ncbi:MAG: helix-turn-helix domain-containing protein [Patescibacteria group bacterium]|nr:helix-turn-helix domain-containing protein [Patescibacteria group bacterium]
MTPAQFKKARHKLGLSASELADILGVDARTIRRWEAEPALETARPPHPTAAKVMKWLLNGFDPQRFA